MSVHVFYAELGVELPGRTGDVPVRCFLDGHDDSTPSASVNSETGVWFCHACDVGGSPYDAAIERGLAPAEAMELVKKYGLGLKPEDHDPDDDRRARAHLKEEKEMDPLPSEEALAGWRCDLLDNKHVMQRLLELRGWTSPTLNVRGVGYDGERIVFAIHNAEGVLINLARYRPGERDDAKKTLVLTGRPREMFPAPESIDRDPIWIVEGEADAVSMHEFGLPATSIPGVAGWRKATPERFAGRRVLICLDADDEGRGAATKLADALVGHAAEVRIVDIAPERDDGFDVGDMVVEASRNGGLKGAKATLLKLAAGAEPLDPKLGAPPVPRLRIVTASVVRPRSTRWIWNDHGVKRIPLGSNTVTVGREGTGKSTLTCRLAADTSRGVLPGELYGQPADVVIATLEDPLAEIVVPRLIAAGADLERVHFITINGDAEEPFAIPDDLERLEDAAASVRARLIFIDPLVATLPEKINAHRDQHVRRALAPLGDLAARLDAAVASVIHFNKATGSDALLRVGGSIAFVAAARSVLAFGYDPDDPNGEASDRRVLAHPKSNFSRKARSIRCEIIDTLIDYDGARIETSRLEFGEECDIKAAEFFKATDPDERSKVEEAVEWLGEHLAGGEKHESGSVKAAAKADEIKPRTLQRARKRLGVEVDEEGFPARSYWRLPVVPTPDTDEVGTTDGTRIGEPNAGPGSRSCANHEGLAQLDLDGGATEPADDAQAVPDEAFIREHGIDPADWS